MSTELRYCSRCDKDIPLSEWMIADIKNGGYCRACRRKYMQDFRAGRKPDVLIKKQTHYKCSKCKYTYSKSEMSIDRHYRICKACDVIAKEKNDDSVFTYMSRLEYESGYQRLIKKNTSLVLELEELRQEIDKLKNKLGEQTYEERM